MALQPALLKREIPVEERIARLESDVGHIKSDVAEMKGDIREIKTDVRQLDTKIEQLDTKIEKYRGVDRVWWLTIAAALLGVMAHGFKWV